MQPRRGSNKKKKLDLTLPSDGSRKSGRFAASEVSGFEINRSDVRPEGSVFVEDTDD